MNKKALTKHDIYSKLIDFSEQDLSVIAGFIDSITQALVKFIKLQA